MIGGDGMAKDIQWMGAIFPDVPSITLPQQGGGLASFDDTSDGNIIASDVAQGKIGYAQGQRVVGTAVAPTGSQTFTNNGTYDVASIAEAVINVAGGGGASNVVSGEFTGMTEGGNLDINVPYTGDGYPVAILIYPSGGVPAPGSDFANLLLQYSIGVYVAVKNDFSSIPTYTNDTTAYFMANVRYKNNATNAGSYVGAGATNHPITTGVNAINNANAYNTVMFKSKNVMNVMIRGSGTTKYGYAADIPYTYYIIYST